MSDPTPTPAAPGGSTADPGVEALQVALGAEHAAVFVLAAIGGQTSASSDPRLYRAVVAAHNTHRERRDELMAMIDATGTAPVAAESGYALPDGLGTARGNAAAALALEHGATAAYAYVVASTTGDHRAWAVDALLDSAVRELTFGGRPEILPGL